MVVVMIQKQDLIRFERFQVTYYILYDFNTYESQPGETRYFSTGIKKGHQIYRRIIYYVQEHL